MSVTVNQNLVITAEGGTLQSAVSGAGNEAKSILTIGGDHPYAQWWGSNGNDGMAAMFLDAGIKPYIAICADESGEGSVTSGYGATLSKPGMMTIEQAQSLQARGAEFISHGSRHANLWELFNTGIRVWYTGGEATPTVNISTTQLTTSTATTGATAFTWAANPTLAQLRTAIKALAGWNCELASELLGTEPSAAMMPLNAARSVTDPGGADDTKSNQRFAVVGGVLVRYTGQLYRDVSISVNDGSSFLSIFADGARIAAISTAATLTTIVTAINALGVAGLYALVMDNGYAAQSTPGSNQPNPGQKFRETYCFGDELGTGLHRVPQAQSVGFTGMNVSGGLGLAYVVRRSVVAVKERAASLYGLTIDAFAQPGGRLYPWHLRSVLDEHVTWRGNRSFTENYSALSPHPLRADHPGKFTGHFTSLRPGSSNPYSEADVKSIIDALGDGDGWSINWLNHLCTPTPGDPSPYGGMDQQTAGTYSTSADQDEGPFWRELLYAAAARDAGRIEIAAPSEAENLRLKKRPPSNLIFNPRFRNGRANDLRGITTAGQGQSGIACPGWNIATASSDFSAVTVDAAGEVTITTNGALGVSRTPFGCNIQFEPGKTYDLGGSLNLLAWGAANTVRFGLFPLHSGMGDGFVINQNTMLSHPWFGGFAGDACWQFTVPPTPGPAPARVMSNAGAFAFGGTDSITVNIDSRGATAAIALTGLTTAKAVASAINTELAANANYTAFAQYHTAARAEDNRLIIEAPAVNTAPGDSGSLILLANGVGTPLATLFGAGVSTVRATSKASGGMDSTFIGYRLAILPSATSATQTLKLLAPYCREVKL